MTSGQITGDTRSMFVVYARRSTSNTLNVASDVANLCGQTMIISFSWLGALSCHLSNHKRLIGSHHCLTLWPTNGDKGKMCTDTRYIHTHDLNRTSWDDQTRTTVANYPHVDICQQLMTTNQFDDLIRVEHVVRPSMKWRATSQSSH